MIEKVISNWKVGLSWFLSALAGFIFRPATLLSELKGSVSEVERAAIFFVLCGSAAHLLTTEVTSSTEIALSTARILIVTFFAVALRTLVAGIAWRIAKVDISMASIFSYFILSAAIVTLVVGLFSALLLGLARMESPYALSYASTYIGLCGDPVNAGIQLAAQSDRVSQWFKLFTYLGPILTVATLLYYEASFIAGSYRRLVGGRLAFFFLALVSFLLGTILSFAALPMAVTNSKVDASENCMSIIGDDSLLMLDEK